jgi:carboxyl-terminal processing protease
MKKFYLSTIHQKRLLNTELCYETLFFALFLIYMPKAIKYLISMKRLPLLLLMLSAGIFLTFRTLGTTGKSEPPTKYERILQNVGEI